MNWIDVLGLFGSYGGVGGATAWNQEHGPSIDRSNESHSHMPDSTPFAPFDGLAPNLGGLENAEVDQNDFFEKRFPGDLKLAKALIKGDISVAIAEACSSDFEFPNAEHSLENSVNFGNNLIDNNFEVGRTTITARNIDIEWSDGDDGWKHYKWTADMLIIDGLGFQPTDKPFLAWLGRLLIFPDRFVIRGRFPISGEGVCCPKKE